MNFKLAIAAAVSLSAVMFGAGSGSANDLGAGSRAAAPTYETGYVTTQGRRGGGFRSGGSRYYGGGYSGRRNNTGRNVAIGVGALVLGGIIASQAARANSGGNSCSRWSYNCDRGSRSSCYNFDRYC